MEFVLYKDDVHVLISRENDKVDIAGVKLTPNHDSFYVYEAIVYVTEVRKTPIIVHRQSMIYRLKEYLESHEDIFGFVDSELDKIHYFKK